MFSSVFHGVETGGVSSGFLPQLHSYQLCSFQIAGLKLPNVSGLWGDARNSMLGDVRMSFAYAAYSSGVPPPHAVKASAAQTEAIREIEMLPVVAFSKRTPYQASCSSSMLMSKKIYS